MFKKRIEREYLYKRYATKGDCKICGTVHTLCYTMWPFIYVNKKTNFLESAIYLYDAGRSTAAVVV